MCITVCNLCLHAGGSCEFHAALAARSTFVEKPLKPEIMNDPENKLRILASCACKAADIGGHDDDQDGGAAAAIILVAISATHAAENQNGPLN